MLPPFLSNSENRKLIIRWSTSFPLVLQLRVGFSLGGSDGVPLLSPLGNPSLHPGPVTLNILLPLTDQLHYQLLPSKTTSENDQNDNNIRRPPVALFGLVQYCLEYFCLNILLQFPARVLPGLETVKEESVVAPQDQHQVKPALREQLDSQSDFSVLISDK